jgi:D-alanyl-D-alanine carboxypeptidase
MALHKQWIFKRLLAAALAVGLGGLMELPAPARAQLVPQAQLEEALAVTMRRYDAPGGVLLLSGPEGPPQIAAAGLADQAQRRPVKPDTRFHVASTGKMMTAVAILQLVQEGKVTLDSPVVPLVDLPGAARLPNIATATVGDLLSHRSGLPDCLRNAKTPNPRHPNPRWTAAEALTSAPCGVPTKPGVHAYSNTNFILLGHIVEKLDRRSLAESLAARVFRPAGMTATTLGANWTGTNRAEANLAHGYRAAAKKGGKREDASAYAYSSPLGDAPVTTTAADLDHFMTALFRRPGLLLRPETLEAMLEDRAGEESDDGYGYGVAVEDSDWGKKYGHSGRLAGFRCEAWHFPDVNRTIILILNGDENSPDDVGIQLASVLLPLPPPPLTRPPE